MPPTLQQIRYDPILSNVSVAYQNDLYIAEQLLPIIQSKKKTGKYYKYGKEKFRRTKSHRGMGAKTNEVGYGLTQSTPYVIEEHALKELVPNELKDQSPKPLTPEIDATENVTERMLIEKEYDLAAYMQSTSNISNNITLSGTSQWSDYANSDPIGVVRTAKQTIHSLIFKDPNVLVLGKQVFDKLVDHPDILDRIKYTKLGVATTDLLARLFGVEKVIIASAGYESAKEGQDSSMAYIWGKYAWLLYVTPKPGIKQVSFGYHFQMKAPRMVDKWYVNDRKGTFVRVTDSYVREIVSTDCAYLIKDTVA